MNLVVETIMVNADKNTHTKIIKDEENLLVQQNKLNIVKYVQEIQY